MRYNLRSQIRQNLRAEANLAKPTTLNTEPRYVAQLLSTAQHTNVFWRVVFQEEYKYLSILLMLTWSELIAGV